MTDSPQLIWTGYNKKTTQHTVIAIKHTFIIDIYISAEVDN